MGEKKLSVLLDELILSSATIGFKKGARAQIQLLKDEMKALRKVAAAARESHEFIKAISPCIEIHSVSLRRLNEVSDQLYCALTELDALGVKK